MTAFRASFVNAWHRVPRWARAAYGLGWLLTSLLFSSFFLAAWVSPDRLDWIVLYPILLGAVWPIALLGLILFILFP